MEWMLTIITDPARRGNVLTSLNPSGSLVLGHSCNITKQTSKTNHIEVSGWRTASHDRTSKQNSTRTGIRLKGKGGRNIENYRAQSLTWERDDAFERAVQ